MQYPQIFATGAGCQHHTLGDAEAHLARRQIGHHHRQLALQILRCIGALDAGEDVARLTAEIEGEAQQFLGALDVFGLFDARDAQVDLGEVVEGNGLGNGVGL